MKKIKIEIKHWATDSVLFEYECKDNTIKKTLKEAVSRGADLWGADLRGADLRGADLRGANLWDANLRGANLRGADLRGADLRGADLRDANLWDANLQGANLQDANLWGVNLRGANLQGADLWGANLRGANLRDANLEVWWHVHHEVLYEILTEPIRNRINYIKTDKPKGEIKLRLKLLKPVLDLDIWPKNEKEWEKLHKKECGCGWNGKTIFTKKNGFRKAGEVNAN